MSRSVLVLLWRTAELLAVDCAAGQSRLVGHVACAGRDARSAAGELLDAVKSSGYTMPEDVRLLVGDALFRSWSLPLRSRRKASQSLELLLDGEFPFESEALEHKVFFCGKDKGGLSALSVSVVRHSLAEKMEALRELGVRPGMVTAEPLPELMAAPLEARRASVLFVSLKGAQSYAAVLEQGRPQKIVSFAASGEASRLAANLQLLRGHKGQKLLVHGGDAETRQELARALGIPLISSPFHALPGGDEQENGWRESAESVIRMPQPGTMAWMRRPFDMPFFQSRGAGGVSPACSRTLAVAACGLLLASGAWMGSILAEDMALRKAAARYEAEARAATVKAVPQLRRQMTLGQMESALRGRLKESSSVQAQSGGWVMPLLQAVHSAVPQGGRIQIDSLRGDTLRQGGQTAALSGTAADYQLVDSFRDALAAMPGVSEVRVVQAVNRSAGKGGASPSVGFELQLLLQEQGR